MTDRKKPGVAFWATVVVVGVLVGYPLSSGPVLWVNDQLRSEAADTCFSWVYAPLIWLWTNSPGPIFDLLTWWFDLWRS